MDSSFKLVLQSVEPERMPAVRRELGRIFEIDEDIASDIVGAAPIILLAGLSFPAAMAIRRRLEPIFPTGARLVTTDAACDDIPKVNWPEPPAIADVPQAEIEGKVPPYREVASFRCPGCGEPFRLVRATPGAPPAERLAPPAPAPAPRPAPAPPPAPSPAPAPAPARAPAPAALPALAPAPAAASTAPAASLASSSPLLRALEIDRERRVSARLPAQPPSPPPAAATATATAPAPPPARREEGRLEDTLVLDRSELPSDSIDLKIAAAAAPAPAAPPKKPAPDPLDDFGNFDIDEALRLLDNAPEAPAPAGARAAPPPSAAAAPPRPTARPTAIDFKEIESDVISLEAALEHPPVADDSDELPALAKGGAAADVRGSKDGGKRPDSSGSLKALDPLEALNLLENEKSKDSSDDRIFARPPRGKISDELEPLDPNEALSILQQQAAGPVPSANAPPPPPSRDRAAPKHDRGAGSGTGTQILPAFKQTQPGRPALMTSAPPPQAPPGSAAAHAPPHGHASSKSGRYPGASPEVPKERKALVDSSDLDFEIEPAPAKAAAPRVVPPAPGASAPKPAAPPGARKIGSGERAAAGSKKLPAARQPGDEEPVHGLVLSKITGEGRRQKAAEIISEMKNIPKDEAMKLTDRTIIPVLKGVSKEDAEAALRRFERSKISGRVTTRRLGE